MPTIATFRCVAPFELKVAECQGVDPRPGVYRCPRCALTVAQFRLRVKGKAASTDKKVDARRHSISRLMDTPGITANQIHIEWTKRVETLYTSLFSGALPDARTLPRFALCLCGSLARREACPYSDIDSFLVVEETSDKTVELFQKAAVEVDQCLLEMGGEVSGFRLCSGGLTPVNIIETPEGLIQMLERLEVRGEGTTADHMLSVKEARFLYGNVKLFNRYEKLLGQYKAANRDTTLKNALKSIKQGVADLRYIPDPTKETFLNVKADLYRTLQVLLRDLAAFFGVDAHDGRGQVLGLVEAGHMSVGVSNLVINMLEDIGKLRVKTQLGQGKENEGLYMNVPSNTDEKGPGTIARGVDVEMVFALRDRLRIWKKLAEAFVKEQDRYTKDWKAAQANRPTGLARLTATKIKVTPASNPYLNPNPRNLLT